ncbi:MAG: hypothetical protein HY731_14310 [Candidatus Tectomicrobia bacterium]|nr:hypothetical protein [Candidatus Tectomicrobia bacterium]
MGNQAVIQFRKFMELDDSLKKRPIFGESCYYGFVVFDDYGMMYSTIIGTRGEMLRELDKYGPDPLVRALGIVSQFSNEVSEAILWHVIENRKGITINGHYYDSNDVQVAYRTVTGREENCENRSRAQR